MKDGVKRIPVREGRIRGTLFLPPGDGPFPGILDIVGAAGSLNETKGSLLAANGFATLSLAYFAHDDLPKLFKDVDYVYFEEAADWLACQPNILPRGIGAIGTSLGTQFLFMLAIRKFDLIKAMVAVSPMHGFIFTAPYKGGRFSTLELDFGLISRTEQGYAVYKDTVVYNSPTNQDNSSAIIPVEKIQCPILYVYGKDDLNVPAEYSVKRMMERMKEHGKEGQCTYLGYPGAGHIIDPPHTPHAEFSFGNHPIADFYAWGGQAKSHAFAQEDSWRNILKFFHNHLSKRFSDD